MIISPNKNENSEIKNDKSINDNDEVITINNEDDFQILDKDLKYNIRKQNDNLCLNNILLSNKITNKNITDEEQLRYNFIKTYTKLKPNTGEKFLERMKYDIDNRKTKEKKMNEFVEKSKKKINEKEKIKSFNRLIEDANRRIKIKEKIKLYKDYKEKEEIKNLLQFNMNNSNKKYSEAKWKEIYHKRFGIYIDSYNKKLKEKIIEKELKEKNKENDIINLCKNKKLPEKDIINYCTKMYNDYMLKKIKVINKSNDLDNYKNEKYKSKNNKMKEYKRKKSEWDRKDNKNEFDYLEDINENLDNKNNNIDKPYFKQKISEKNKINQNNNSNNNRGISQDLIDTFFYYKNFENN